MDGRFFRGFCLKRPNDYENDNGDQQDNRQLVEPAIEDMAFAVTVVFEIVQQPGAIYMVGD